MAKKKKQSPPRMSIVLPADLKKRMRRISEEVNWSAVATAAFERKLNELEVTDMPEPDQTVRLRAERDQRRDQDGKPDDPVQARERDIRRGKEGGKLWAEKEAGPTWFGKLDGIAEQAPAFFSNNGFSDEAHQALTPLFDELFLLFVGKTDWGRHIWLWSRYDSVQHSFPDPSASPAYIHGFLLGALDVWRKKKAETFSS